jgi:predicted DNA-binding transcriptional regulator AlpA
MPDILEDRLYTIAETAAIMQKAVATLYNMRSRGEGPESIRVAGRVMYRASALRRWLEEQEAASRRGGDAA